MSQKDSQPIVNNGNPSNILSYRERYMAGSYLNPFTDFGFKRLFGTEENKKFLKDFLNELLREEEGEIIELTYLPTEQIPDSPEKRRAIFDIYCKNEKGEYFIVEMQKYDHRHFKERSVFYSSFAIQQQARKDIEDKGYWDYNLKSVYTIALLYYPLSDTPKDRYAHYVKLMDTHTKEVFFDKLTYVYIELSKFDKQLHEITNDRDRWLYTLSHLCDLEEVPEQLQGGIFPSFFKTARIAGMSEDEQMAYEYDLNKARIRAIEEATARDKAIAEGLEQGRAEGLKEGLEKGLEQGRQKGIEEGRKLLIEQLKQQGVDPRILEKLQEFYSIKTIA